MPHATSMGGSRAWEPAILGLPAWHPWEAIKARGKRDKETWIVQRIQGVRPSSTHGQGVKAPTTHLLAQLICWVTMRQAG